MSLSVCIICKNEEKNIERCLESIKNIADEIIVVDTGSTDRSIEIAENYDTIIIKHKWDNDFSKARNISIEKATSKWILILDADEELDKENGLKLIDTINNHNMYEGFFLTLSNVIDGKESSKAVVFRLFKNNPLYKFEGKIHEQVITSIFKYNSQENILDTDIKILHYGYDLSDEEEEMKSKRNLDILLNYEDKYKDGYYYYSLGNEFIRANNHDKCINYYEKSISLTDFPNQRPIYFPYLLLNLIKLLLFHEKIEEANNYFNYYIKYLKDFKDLYFLGALSELGLNRFSNAKELMYKYNTIYPTHNLYPSNNLNEIYNILEINKAIDQGVFIENNSRSNEKLDLSVVIINTCYKEKIETCLDSIKKLNCEKILISTQTLDNKCYIEDKYNVKIIETKFDNNYSILKNTMFNNIVSDDKWILSLDSNELLEFDGLLKLQNLLLSNREYKAFEVSVLVNNNSKVTLKTEIRLFKYNRNLRFRGKLYEEITSSCIDVFKKSFIANVDIQIINYTDKFKLDERLSVLNSYKEDEKDNLYYFYKGNDFFRNQDFINSSMFYKESFRLLDKENIYKLTQYNSYIPLLALNICISLLNIFEYKETIYYANTFLNYYKDFAVLYIIKAYCNMKLNLEFDSLLNEYNYYKINTNYPFINLENLF